MRITLLILVYNNEEFVERTLASILENENEFYDVIINDDCSTDSSASVIQKFLKDNQEATTNWELNLNPVNIGINASFKNILSKNKNIWIKYLAGDDELEKDSLLNYYIIAKEKNAQNTIVLSDMSLINQNSDFIGIRKSLSPCFYENNWLKTVNLYINTINAPTVMIGRQTLLSALDGTKVKNAEDWPVLRFCTSRSYKFYVSRKSLVRYRIHDKSLSAFYKPLPKNDKVLNKIGDQVEILLNENRALSELWSVRKGIKIQLKLLSAESKLERIFFKVLKIFNLKFCIFRILAYFDTIRK